jgi:mannose-6-phosphate isomerase-like protein (cupin superfamily)
MTIKQARLPGAVIALLRDGTTTVVDAPTRPVRLDGLTFGVADVASVADNPPHNGEMHPDGDELLYLVSGRADVIIEEGGTQETVGAETRVALGAGEAIVVPRGHWHRIELVEPYRLVHVTPGPGDGHRPLTRD